jgi:hypothetical protein
MTQQQRQEQDEQLKEILDNMATLNDLFGGGGTYGPKFVNLKNPGEFIKGVVTKIDTEATVSEWDVTNNKPGLQKFWVDGKPKGVPKDEAERAGLRPVHQVEVHLSDVVGEWDGKPADLTEARVTVTGSADERAKFKAAVEEAGGNIEEGDVLGKKLDKRNGNKKEHSMKIVKA